MEIAVFSPMNKFQILTTSLGAGHQDGFAQVTPSDCMYVCKYKRVCKTQTDPVRVCKCSYEAKPTMQKEPIGRGRLPTYRQSVAIGCVIQYHSSTYEHRKANIP